MWMHRVKGGVVLLAGLALSGCGYIGDVVDNGDSFEDRAEALSAVYDQGKQARKSMTKVGVVVDETSCGSAWVTSGAKDAENDMSDNYSSGNNRAADVNFQELRRLSFINGCMDRPNQLPAVTAPALVTPSVTPSS